MPRPILPPTPGSSTDIAAKPDMPARQISEPGFELPPPALEQEDGQRMSIDCDNTALLISPEVSPPTPSSRRRLSAAKPARSDETFKLPPPPMRSRKIIQMKPGPDDKKPIKLSPASAKSSPQKGKEDASKKKQPSSTSAAGRKIARKTAHSLIERRRRSKMNEEFGVLKDMIPACKGQEMHKLAILQASIEYLRYLERCVQDLKHSADESRRPPVTDPMPLPEAEMIDDSSHSSEACHDSAEEQQQDASDFVFSSTVSPAIFPQNSSGEGDIDREATEALLMLNADRRGSRSRGISVRDLLREETA